IRQRLVHGFSLPRKFRTYMVDTMDQLAQALLGAMATLSVVAVAGAIVGLSLRSLKDHLGK
ncbi:MAG: hypothetical protein QOK47_65, partial [Actinomycetota bacterium]|nr:hypothetical protein [Actinomycetota bacterium]